MFRFSGFFDCNASFLSRADDFRHTLSEMSSSLFYAKNDNTSSLLTNCCGLISETLPHTNMTTGITSINIGDCKFHAVVNGELYNTKELFADLRNTGLKVDSTRPADLLLAGFIRYGTAFFRSLEGCFSACIYAEDLRELYLIRDSFGTKPLFYTFIGNCLVFSVKLKSLLAFPGITPKLDYNGLNEIFSLGPGATPGCAVLDGMCEVLPGHYLRCNHLGLHTESYWRLSAHPHTDNYKDTVEKTSFLVSDAVKRQMSNAKTIGTLLSGGLDSCIVSALCAKELSANHQTLTTFSFDYEGNSDYFASNAYQPSEDYPYVQKMSAEINSTHHVLVCPQETLVDRLTDSLSAHDLPCMADIDSSLNYFCGEVVKKCDVVLTGECADEVFGGYPWFYKDELLSLNTFPWMPTLTPRRSLLKHDFAEALHMEKYVQKTYHSFLAKVPYLPEDSPEDRVQRRIGYLSLYGFMQTLLNRMERCSSYHGLTARVPFADRRLVSYVFNIPRQMKYIDGVEKHLLRSACGALLPTSIRNRKKSPFPKTYHPLYEQLLAARLRDVLSSQNAPIKQFLDADAVHRFLESPKNYGSPWYGQLMAGPQMIAYLLQINQWMQEYQIEIHV